VQPALASPYSVKQVGGAGGFVIAHLRAVASQLREKLCRLTAEHTSVVAENSRLKDEVRVLRDELSVARRAQGGSAALDESLAPLHELLSSRSKMAVPLDSNKEVGGAGESGGSQLKLVADPTYFVFGESHEFLFGLLGVTGGSQIVRSIEEEFRLNDEGAWWAEFEYVAHQAAEENPMHLPSTQKFLGVKSIGGAEIVRDQGHAGWTLRTFCDTQEAQQAKLTEAEVCALRLYTGPVFAALNAALREQKIGDWATTIACCYSGTLKLSSLSKPTRVYRGVRESTMQLPSRFYDLGTGGFAGGVERAFMSTTKSPAVAIDYSGGEETPGSILIIDFEMGSRGAGVRWASQYPHEEELLFPPLTTLSTRKVSHRGSKRLINCSVDVSTAVPSTSDIRTPTDVPGALRAMCWLAEALKIEDVSAVEACDLVDISVTGTSAENLALLLGRARYVLPKCTSLNLHNTQLNDADVEALAAALPLNRTLRELDLGNNKKITPLSGTHMADAIRRGNSALTALHLYDTSVGAVGARRLGDALLAATQADATALEVVTLHFCPLPVQQLTGRAPVRAIDLTDRSLSAADGALIAALIQSNQTLRSLRLADNRLTEAAQDFASRLRGGAASNLTELNLEGNSIDKEHKRALKQAVAARKQLKLFV